MKVDHLLGPYLYQHKTLSLPGIGVFTMADTAVLPDDNAKIKLPIEGISFHTGAGTELDNNLIQYIKEQTGKMRPLAEADLHSFIATALQFLNIGKPFYFEGIGSLQKNKEAAYIFTAGTVISPKTEDTPARFTDNSTKHAYATESDTAGKPVFNAGRLVAALGILVTLALVGWGGYYLYHNNTGERKMADTPPETTAPAAADTTTATVAVKPDSITHLIRKDSSVIAAPARTDSATSYKFIFETTAKKKRALTRYNQLKDAIVLGNYNNKVALETKDSLTFNIYTLVACAAADTSHVKKMLNAWYYGSTAVKVKIEL